MKTSTRFLWGGVGALVPILLSLAVADIDKLMSYLSEEHIKMVGYALRALALFAIGGIWVVAQGSIRDIGKAIQIGVAAPAAITVWISGANLDMERQQSKAEPHVAALATSPAAPTIRMRGTSAPPPRPSTPTRPPKSPFETFIDGVLGR